MINSNNTLVTEARVGITFIELIKKNNIQIPIIQRDYAQGRLDEKTTEIRDGFLTAIIEALESENAKPLVLDFVYGSMTEDNVFLPLDGQQRLTTLFLLHWYLASGENISTLRIKSNNSIVSKFSYETRISSRDFCNSLVNNLCEDIKESSAPLLSESIKNQHWFMWSWRKDPTISSMLVMLNEIDARLGKISADGHKSMWEKLENGKIIFYRLPLEKFNLTEELYVKMNARGKELSKFDVFKSTMEEQMRLNSVSENTQNKWRSNVDSNWIDLFWNKLAKSRLQEGISNVKQIECVASVEDSYLEFLKQMIILHLFLNDDCFQCNWSDLNIKRYVPFEYEESKILNMLRDFSVRNDVLRIMPLLIKTKFFSQIFFDFVINSLDNIIYIENHEKYDGSELIKDISFEINQKTIFEAFIDKNITYDTRVQFFALLQFFKYIKASDIAQNEDSKAELNSWMRIIRNLSTNTNTYFYNGYDDFLKSLVVIKKWAEEIYGGENQPSIIEYFDVNNNFDGFNGDQLKEEKLKASLIKNSSDWMIAIRTAEEHIYFLGQIRFLLEWSLYNGDYNVETFKEYFDKICSVFEEKGLKSDLRKNNIFRNALMTISDWYLLNNCFISDTEKSRDFSWKRYLRDSDKSRNIKTLLDNWDRSTDFNVFCSYQITENTPSDWRYYFIRKPELYNYLQNDIINWWNWSNKEICLLTKTKWSSKHIELRIYFWCLMFNGTIDSESTTYEDSMSVKFDKGGGFSISYTPKKLNGEWQNGDYLVSTNFNPILKDFIYSSENNRWERKFNYNNFYEIEKIIIQLSSMNQNYFFAGTF